MARGKLGVRFYKALISSRTLKEIAVQAGVTRVRRGLFGRRVRVRFIVDYEAMGLSPVLMEVRSIHGPRGLPKPYTLAVYSLRGTNGTHLVIGVPPREYVEDYVSLFRDSGEVWAVEHIDMVFWEPDERFFDGEAVRWEALRREAGSPGWSPSSFWLSSRARKRVAVDGIDLHIIRELYETPYASIARIARSMGISKQLATYHYYHHVLPLWRGNSARPVASHETHPLWYLRVEPPRTYRQQMRLLTLLMRVPGVSIAVGRRIHTLVQLSCGDVTNLLEVPELVGTRVSLLTVVPEGGYVEYSPPHRSLLETKGVWRNPGTMGGHASST